jgi:hypothetical protein
LKKDIHKSDAKDDFIDALRYAVMAIPWDFEYLNEVIKFDNKEPEPEIIQFEETSEIDKRREFALGHRKEGENTIEEELAEWDELINDVEF